MLSHPNCCSISSSSSSVALTALRLPLVSNVQPRAGVNSCQDPLVAPQGFQPQSSLPAVLRVFAPGNLPHSHLQSLFWWQTEQFLLAFCASECARRLSRFSPSLHCCRPPISTYFMDPGSQPPEVSTWAYLFASSSHLPNT